VLIVMADQLGRSVGDMYEGAFIPGLFLAGMYALYVFIVTLVKPKAVPGLPAQDVGFKETEAGPRDVLARANGGLLCIGAVAALWLLGRHFYTVVQNGDLTAAAANSDLAKAIIAYAGYSVEVIALVALLWSLTRLVPRVRLGGDERGLLSLATLAVIATIFAWSMMRNSNASGADYVVLSMFYGIIFAFAVAVVNKATSRMFGFRFLSHIAQQTTFVMVPPLFLIFLVLGTIFIGVATPTEGGAMGASGALIMALVRGRLTWRLLKQAMDTTAKLSCFVLFILLGSTTFNLVFQGVDGSRWVEHLLTGLPGGQLGFLIVVNVLVFVLAFFLDFFELAFIVVPLVGPVAEKLGIDLIWFGVLLGVNMQTSFMHPPFGFALFYLRSVAAIEAYKDRITGKLIAPVTTGQIYWGAVPFVIIQVIMVGLIIAFPGLVSGGLDKQKEVDLEKFRIELPKGDSTPDANKPNLNELFKSGPKGDAGPAAPAAGSAPAVPAPPAADKPVDPMQSILDAVKKEAAEQKK
jgi:TRAP-type mannitol/chloroaromatic compound transport system permease large subunit